MKNMIRRILLKLLALFPEHNGACDEKIHDAHDDEKLIDSHEIHTGANSVHKPSEITNVTPAVYRTESTKEPAPQLEQQGNAYEEYGVLSLSEEQMSVFNEMCQSNDNLFITGKAGTGKSVLLKYFREHTSKRIVVLAPTGIAAINVAGQTIHSFFELSPSLQTEDDFANKYFKDNKENLIKQLDAIVVDEVSMVRADVMDAIDVCLQIGKGRRGVPFGGCQIIAFGDLYQLGPVVSDNEEKEYLINTYGSIFFFGAHGVRQKPFHIIELTQVFRQKDQRFVNLLNCIRTGDNISEAVAELNSICHGTASYDDGIVITPTKRFAKSINDSNLFSLPGQSIEYHAKGLGSFIREDGSLDESKTTAEVVLKLKPGAKVMMLNNDRNKRWINGTFAKVKEATKDKLTVVIDNQEYEVEQHVWEEYAYRYDSASGKIKKMVSGVLEQYPVRLAYAITVHKSQGQTYDKVVIDYGKGKAFAPGQTYVALSRCRSLEGLRIKAPLKHTDVIVNNEITNWITYFQKRNHAASFIQY